ncbi:hypothetical protein QUA28_15260 [Microcoleus sp. Pol14C4]
MLYHSGATGIDMSSNGDDRRKVQDQPIAPNHLKTDLISSAN